MAARWALRSFNPRPRAGGDVGPWGPAGPGIVSIHAPARGATLFFGNQFLSWVSFNPRPRAGGDVRWCYRISPINSFNPRPRAGGDPLGIVMVHYICCFNPRPRAGGDGDQRQVRNPWRCFNPRPRAGGDCTTKKYHQINKIQCNIREGCSNSLPATNKRRYQSFLSREFERLLTAR